MPPVVLQILSYLPTGLTSQLFAHRVKVPTVSPQAKLFQRQVSCLPAGQVISSQAKHSQKSGQLLPGGSPARLPPRAIGPIALQEGQTAVVKQHVLPRAPGTRLFILCFSFFAFSPVCFSSTFLFPAPSCDLCFP